MLASRRTVVVVIVFLTQVGLAGHDVGSAPAAPPSPVGQAAENPPDDIKRGLRYGGLRRAAAASRCRRFEMPLASGHVACTHGPDPGPEGIDVSEPAPLPPTQAAETTAIPALGCQGDGTSGPRVQLVYARARNVADRFSAVEASLRQHAAAMDQIINASAAETGGTRHIRFVHDSSCRPVVARVELSNTGDDTFTNTINELAAQGFNRPDRKYLAWVDANVYCGIAQVYEDDRVTADNYNNGRADIPGMVARVDNACWGQSGGSVEVHELLHTIGAVQGSAPNATPNNHCTDDYDRMCYADDAGVSVRRVCASGHENRLDCNHEDYFSTSPAPASYLATHWNSANSAFLTSSAPTPATTTTTTVPPPVPTAPPPPSQAERFVDKAFRDLMGRPPTAAEAAAWVGPLNGGLAREYLTGAIVTTDEFRRRVVDIYYRAFLGRVPDGPGLAAFTNALRAGYTLEQVESAITSSDEFYARVGSTPQGYVGALYSLVGHPADAAGVGFWVAQLRAGVSRYDVALAFFTWVGTRQTVVQVVYGEFLQRPADQPSLNFWIAQLQQGLRQEYLYAFVVASAEYWSKT